MGDIGWWLPDNRVGVRKEGTNSKVMIVGVWGRGGIQVDREAREVQGTRSESLARMIKWSTSWGAVRGGSPMIVLSPGWATAKEGCG